ncbi:MAG TPA: oxidoreductase [Nocardioidaceae bacterium]|nr:oxidoreductase [Nocardioidaceae bacterium]
MSGPTWSLAEMPDLTGRRGLVTGVTGGIGEHTALELARSGAEVILAGRSEEKLSAVVDDIRRTLPNAVLRPVVMDLADLASVRRAAAEASTYGPLDILVNNAGVMATPARRTADGFDLQMGTNHFGHFALTGLLLPQLVASGSARVVTLASQMHRVARSVPVTDPRVDHGGYNKWRSYGQSKLANLLFMLELDRRARAADLPITSVGAHPGYAATNLMSAGLGMHGRTAEGSIIQAATRVLAQPAEMGALPSLMAATMPGLPGGAYLGPSGPGEMRGAPTIVRTSRQARDPELAAALWRVSEEATGVTYP